MSGMSGRGKLYDEDDPDVSFIVQQREQTGTAVRGGKTIRTWGAWEDIQNANTYLDARFYVNEYYKTMYQSRTRKYQYRWRLKEQPRPNPLTAKYEVSWEIMEHGRRVESNTGIYSHSADRQQAIAEIEESFNKYNVGLAWQSQVAVITKIRKLGHIESLVKKDRPGHNPSRTGVRP